MLLTMNRHELGDLVHIPQAVDLIDCEPMEDPQLTIPLRVQQTLGPTIGVVTRVTDGGYVRVYCEGNSWSVRNNNVYTLKGT